MKHSTWALLAIAALTWPLTAHAHPTRRSFRLGLGVPGLSVTHFPSPNATTVTYALPPRTFGLQLGVQVTPEIGILAIVLGGGEYSHSPGIDTNVVSFAFVPRFEYMFTPHGTVGIYLGGDAGFEISGATNTNLRDVFRTGGFFGLHIFAETEVSVDMELEPTFLYDFDLGSAGFRGVFYISMTGWLRI